MELATTPCVRLIKKLAASAILILGFMTWTVIAIWLGYNTGVIDTFDWLKAKKQAKGDAPLLIYDIPEDRPRLFQSNNQGEQQ